MAKNRNYQSNSNGNSSKKRNGKYTEDERLAYKLGKIQASLNNDCRVKDSYENGRKSASEEKKKKKPLY